jgi:hypothetical protein
MSLSTEATTIHNLKVIPNRAVDYVVGTPMTLGDWITLGGETESLQALEVLAGFAGKVVLLVDGSEHFPVRVESFRSTKQVNDVEAHWPYEIIVNREWGTWGYYDADYYDYTYYAAQ